METQTQVFKGEKVKEKAQEAVEGAREKVNRTIETTASMTPSPIFIIAALGSIAASLFLQIRSKRQMSLFVGQWVPSFLLFGIYNKLAKSLGAD